TSVRDRPGAPYPSRRARPPAPAGPWPRPDPHGPAGHHHTTSERARRVEGRLGVADSRTETARDAWCSVPWKQEAGVGRLRLGWWWATG
ncbi:hypothetical protein, partial [Haloechinothrix sp. LS1_15]|uniref:hypothetical protein n=1 Tax=Haloechinothrix sp. LS1_15 TaxID=2652248 RepID=UPI00294AD306